MNTMEIQAVENGYIVNVGHTMWGGGKKKHVFDTWTKVAKFVLDNQVRVDGDDA